MILMLRKFGAVPCVWERGFSTFCRTGEIGVLQSPGTIQILHFGTFRKKIENGEAAKKKPTPNFRDKRMKRQKTKLNEYPGLVIEACKDGNGEEAYRIFEEARQAGLELENGAMFTKLFGVFAKKGMGLEALKTLHKMETANVMPSTPQMLAVADAIVHSKSDESEKELRSLVEMTKAERWRGDTVFQKKLLESFASISDRFETADVMTTLLKRLKLQPKERLKLFTETLFTVGEKSHAQMIALFRGCKTLNIEPDSRVFVALMKGFARHGEFDQFFSIFEQMKTTHHHLLDKYVLTLVLRTCNNTRRFSAAQSIIDMLDSEFVGQFDWEWDLPLVNELMLIASHTSNATALVKKVIQQMEMKKIEMDVNSYNMRIALHARLKEVDQAFQVAKEMQKRDIEFNNATMTELLTACRAASDPERAFGLFQQMKDVLPPDNEIHISILQSIFTRAKRFDLEQEWRKQLGEWKEQNGSSVYDGPKPYKTVYKEKMILSEQQMKKAGRVSQSRKKWQQKMAEKKT